MKNLFTYLILLPFLLGMGGCFWARPTFDVSGLEQYDNIVEVAIIGSGPAGAMAATYVNRGGMQATVFQGDLPGGLLTQTSMVENWPGETSILGPEIIEKMKKQAEHVGVSYVNSTITKVDFSRWPFALTTDDDKTIHALSVIIATGASPRRLKVAGEEQYWGTGVTACATCDAPFYKNEEVVVVGGGDSAAEEAIQLTPFAKKVTILVRKGQMRAAARMMNHLKAYDKIDIKYNVAVNRIIGDDTKVKAVELLDTLTGKTTTMATSGVFLAIGHIPNTKIFEGQLKMDGEGYLIMTKGRTQQTSVPGVFAAGDVEDREYRQAGVAAGEGIKAGLDALNFLNEIGVTPSVIKAIDSKRFKAEQKKEPAVEIESITSQDQLDEFKKDDVISVVDFYADWCPSCVHMLPAFEQVAQESQGVARFAKVNVDDAEDLADSLFINSIPCIMVFRNGTMVARFNEAMNKQELAHLVQQQIR